MNFTFLSELSERNKKILAVAGFVLSVAAIGTALYLIFFSAPNAELPPATATIGGVGTLPTTTGGARQPVTPTEETGLPKADVVARGGLTQITAVTDSTAKLLAMGKSGQKINFYNPADKKFYSVGADGSAIELSDQKFPNVQSATWNSAGEKAILEFPDDSNIVYDFAAEKQITLPKHWTDFQFSPLRDEFIAKSLALDPNNRWLVMGSADGSNVRAFQPLGQNENKVTVSWSPNDQIVAFADTADSIVGGGLSRKMILPVGKNGENLKGLIVEGLDFRPLWAPDGKQLLYSVVSDYSDLKPLLWASDAEPATMGENRRSLSVNTWADKCVFASKSKLYCAVPVGLPDNAGLQRVMFQDLPDNLYQIDLNSGVTSLTAVPEVETTMNNLTITEDGTMLYFLNAKTGKMERLRLK